MEKKYDYIVIGSGIAGLTTALLAKEHGSVVILTKGRIDDCNTLYAQGGIAAAIGKDDSPELHMQDTLKAGAGLCDPEAVRVLTHDGPKRMADLIKRGVVFDTIHGEIALATEGAHSLPRVLHIGGDATGKHIELTLARSVAEAGIPVIEYCLASKILLNKNGVTGVETISDPTGEKQVISSNTIVIASGGAGQLYRYTTNPEVATGDGVALAFQARAEVMDMEFYQFHPTALRIPGVPTFLISEAMRGEGAILRNSYSQAFMKKYHPMEELAPRDMVTRAIAFEMDRASSDHVFLDVTHIPADRIRARFPSIYGFCKQHGLDITTSHIPVAPAAHYMMGGIKTNTWGETTISGLYACGEVACTGAHGANRLASNSLLDTLVFSDRLVSRSLQGAGPIEGTCNRPEVPSYMPIRERISSNLSQPSLSVVQDLMWRNVGIVRNEKKLLEAAKIISTWEQDMELPWNRETHELSNLLTVGKLIAESAILRKESRGAHYRDDYPNTSHLWESHITKRRQS